MSYLDLCVIRPPGVAGDVPRLGEPRLDEYLEFVAARCRPNTVLAVAFDLKVFFGVVGKAPAEVTAAGEAAAGPTLRYRPVTTANLVDEPICGPSGTRTGKVPTVEVLNVVLPVVTLLLGALLTEVTSERRRTRERLSALRENRASAYRAFVEALHTAAHKLGRAAQDSEVPLVGENAHDVLALIDSQVSKNLYELEIFAGEPVLGRAREAREALLGLRRQVQRGVAYMSDDYRIALGEYQAARTAFLKEARREVLSGG